MFEVHCTCGAKLDEDPLLPPDQRPPCPVCGSLDRKLERTITDNVFLTDSGTASEALIVRPATIEGVAAIGTPTVVAEAQPATINMAAHDAQTQTTQPEVTDDLAIAEFNVRVEQLEKKPDEAWATRIWIKGSSKPIDMGAAVQLDDVALGIAEAILKFMESSRPPDPE